MKKFIAILFLFAFTMTFVNAQTGTTFSLKQGQLVKEYAGTSLDTTTGTYNQIVHIPLVENRVFYNFQAKIHNDGSAKGAIIVYGRVFSTDGWTSLLTMNTPYGGGQDTVINFTSQTTGSANRYFKVEYVSTAGAAKFTWLKYSFKK